MLNFPKLVRIQMWIRYEKAHILSREIMNKQWNTEETEASDRQEWLSLWKLSIYMLHPDISWKKSTSLSLEPSDYLLGIKLHSISISKMRSDGSKLLPESHPSGFNDWIRDRTKTQISLRRMCCLYQEIRVQINGGRSLEWASYQVQGQ